jgi:hypothetical protein
VVWRERRKYGVVGWFEKTLPWGLDVVSKEVVYIGVDYSVSDGHGKVEKLDCAFQLSHNHGCCWNFCFEN